MEKMLSIRIDEELQAKLEEFMIANPLINKSAFLRKLLHLGLITYQLENLKNGEDVMEKQ